MDRVDVSLPVGIMWEFVDASYDQKVDTGVGLVAEGMDMGLYGLMKGAAGVGLLGLEEGTAGAVNHDI